LALFVVIVLTSYLLANILQNGEVGARLGTLAKLGSADDGRFLIWERAWQMLMDAPWWGIGLGTYWLHWPPYRNPLDSSGGFYVHNDYLQIWIETGLPGLLLLLAVYPLNAWRDAPLFPTPARALDALPRWAPLAPGARVLDAGCGLGQGLAALRRAYPHAQLHGVESSWPLRWLCALRCPWARVRHGDIWAADWSGYDLVYLFQRPESMAHAVAKARAELRPGTWLVSLEFEATAVQSTAQFTAPGGKMVWLYQVPLSVPQGD
jgi:hypothetical protein